MVFLTLFLIPAFIALGFLIFGGRRATLKEFLLQLVIQAVIAGISASVIYWSNTADTEIWSGRITSKERQVVSCRHSYPCNCHQSCYGSGSNQSCSTTCDTCYMHSYDVDWLAHSSIGDFDIDTIDSQGLIQPPRWTAVVIGEPASKTHTYTSYIKASADSLFRRDGDYAQYQSTLPSYPDNVFDYYRIRRLVTVGLSLPDTNAWNKDLDEMNADLGSRKQVNIVLVVVANQPREWFHALEKKWLGGKKNDVIVVVAVDSTLSISWVESMAWTENEMVRIRLRDDLLAAKTLDRTTTTKIIQDDVDHFFVRKPMAEFSYLKASITPTATQWAVAMLIGFLAAIITGWVMVTHDVFNEE